MDSTVIISIAVFIIALAIGFAIAKVLEKKNASKIILNAQNEADVLLKNVNVEFTERTINIGSKFLYVNVRVFTLFGLGCCIPFAGYF